MIKSLTILGSTGSIGRQSVAVAEHLHLPVAALTTNRKIDLLEEQARGFTRFLWQHMIRRAQRS